MRIVKTQEIEFYTVRAFSQVKIALYCFAFAVFHSWGSSFKTSLNESLRSKLFSSF